MLLYYLSVLTSKVCLQTKTQVLHEPVTVLAGITVGNFSLWADSLLVAVLLYYGANSFKRVTEVKCDNQLPYIFQVRPLVQDTLLQYTAEGVN